MSDAPPDEPPPDFVDEPPPRRETRSTPARIPPHNLDAERALLGALLLSRDARNDVERIISVGDFYRPAHKHIFGAIMALHRHGEVADPITVADELRRSNLIDEAGGTRALVDLQADAPGTANAAHYARIVVDHADLRRVLEVAGEMTRRAYEVPEDGAGPIVEDAVARLAEAVAGGKATAIPPNLFQLSWFLNNRHLERPPWVIPGILRARWRLMVVAPEGVGKTMVFRALAMNTAQGIHPFTGERIPRQTVLMVDCENPDDVILEQCRPIDRATRRHLSDYDDDRVWLLAAEQGMNIRRRADRATLEQAIAVVRPDLVCAGPLYKLFRKDGDSDEDATLDLINVLDDLRARYGFALALEHHAPKKQQGVRDLDPFGSSVLLRWPEVGLKMFPAPGEENTRVELGRFRRDRVRNLWPQDLYRQPLGSMRPWTGGWDPKLRIYDPASDRYDLIRKVEQMDRELDELTGDDPSTQGKADFSKLPGADAASDPYQRGGNGLFDDQPPLDDPPPGYFDDGPGPGF